MDLFRISITPNNYCNFNCEYCCANCQNNKKIVKVDLDINYFKFLITFVAKQFKDIMIDYRILGGETLLYKDINQLIN